MTTVTVRLWLTRAAFVAVAAFIVWVAVRFDEIAAVVYSQSDNASSPVIAELFGERGGGAVVLGNYPWLETLYFLLATKGLPEHELVWEAGPFLLIAASIACVWWSTRRAISPEAATIVALAMAAPAPFLLFILGSPALRGTTFAHVAVLSVFVATLPALSRWGPWGRAAWAAALVVTLAPGAASDPVLFLVAAPAPFLVAVGAGWVLGLLPRAAALLAAGACVAGVALGRALIALAESHDILYRDYVFPLADAGRLWDNLGLLLEDMALFVHGRFGDETSVLDILLEGVAILAVVTLPVLVVLGLLRARPVLMDSELPPSRRILGVFWAVVIAALWAAFVTSSAPEDISAIRYVSMVWPGLLVLAVILWDDRALTALAGIALATAVLGCIQLAGDRYTDGDPEAPRRAEAEQLTELIAGQELARGYGDYWDAAGLTYLSDYEARVYPVRLCGVELKGRCSYYLHKLDAWYEPEPGTRSFYLHHLTRDSEQIGPPPAEWGPYERKVRVGQTVVYVYDYDLATVLGEDPGQVPDPSPATTPSRGGGG